MNESPDDPTQGRQFGDGRDEVPSLRIGRFRLYEPATTITDVLLAVLAFGLTALHGFTYFDLRSDVAVALTSRSLPPAVAGVVRGLPFMAAALLSIGAAALAGAWIHGRGPMLSAQVRRGGWTFIGLALTTSATALYGVAANLSLSLPQSEVGRVGALAFAAGAILAWSGLALGLHRGAAFATAQVSVGVAATAVGVASLLRAASIREDWSLRSSAAWWTGLMIYAVATALQSRRIGPHARHFDHNALYHVLQMLALAAMGYVATGMDLGGIMGVWIP